MDTIIVYKEKQNLKDSIQKVRLSHTRPYTLHFSDSKLNLQRQLKPDTKALLFYFTKVLNQGDRVFIQTIKNSCPDIRICLCSHASYALDAWKLDLFHFEAYPIKAQQIKTGYQKYVRHVSDIQTQFSIKTSEGTVLIPFKQLLYLYASGNYTNIHLKSNKKYLITKQLNKYEFIVEQDAMIKRLHRSYIFNLRNIKTLRKKSVLFYGSDEELDISQALSTKIKKELLGSN